MWLGAVFSRGRRFASLCYEFILWAGRRMEDVTTIMALGPTPSPMPQTPAPPLVKQKIKKIYQRTTGLSTKHPFQQGFHQSYNNSTVIAMPCIARAGTPRITTTIIVTTIITTLAPNSRLHSSTTIIHPSKANPRVVISHIQAAFISG